MNPAMPKDLAAYDTKPQKQVGMPTSTITTACPSTMNQGMKTKTPRRVVTQQLCEMEPPTKEYKAAVQQKIARIERGQSSLQMKHMEVAIAQ